MDNTNGTNEQIEKLDKMTEAAKPLIQYLNENHNPHVTAIVTTSGIELMSGIMSNPNITEFIKD